MNTLLLLSILLLNNPVANSSDQIGINDQAEILKTADQFSQRQIKKGLKHLNKALLYAPENKNYQLIFALFLSTAKKFTLAYKLIETLPTIREQKFYRFLNIFFLKTEPKKLLKELQKLKNDQIQSKDIPPEHLLFLSVSAYFIKQKQLSRWFFDQAIAQEQNLLDITYQLDTFRDIIILIYNNLNVPRDIFYYNSFAKLMIRLKSFNRAQNALQKSIELEKKNPVAFKLYADIYLALGEKKQAEQYLKQAIYYLDFNKDVYHNFISINSEKPAKERIDFCSKALKFVPQSKEVMLCLARGYKELKQYQKAIYYLNFVLNKDGDNFDANLLMGDTIRDFTENLRLRYEKGYISEYELAHYSKQSQKEPTEYYIKAITLRPFDFIPTARFYREMLQVDLLNHFDLPFNLSEAEPKVKKQLEELLRKREAYFERKNYEDNLYKFYKLFKKYIETKDETLISQMKFLNISKTMLLYIDYLKKPSDQLFNKMMAPLHKNYIKEMIKGNVFYMLRYLHKLGKGKNSVEIEDIKFFNFLKPDIFG